MPKMICALTVMLDNDQKGLITAKGNSLGHFWRVDSSFLQGQLGVKCRAVTSPPPLNRDSNR